LDDCVNYSQIFASGNGIYREFKGENKTSDTPVEEVCGEGVTKLMTY
jgi:hypothetical protein